MKGFVSFFLSLYFNMSHNYIVTSANRFLHANFFLQYKLLLLVMIFQSESPSNTLWRNDVVFALDADSDLANVIS